MIVILKNKLYLKNSHDKLCLTYLSTNFKNNLKNSINRYIHETFERDQNIVKTICKTPGRESTL